MAGRKKIIKGVSAAKKKREDANEFLGLAAEQQVEKVFDEVIAKGAEKFTRELFKLEGKEYVDRFMAVVEYIKPKLSKVDKQGGEDDRITLNFITSGSNKAMEILASQKAEKEINLIETGDFEEIIDD